MTYDEVQEGQTVRIMTRTPKYRINGVVWAKEKITAGERTVERVYVDTERPRSRRLCHPSILEPVNG